MSHREVEPLDAVLVAERERSAVDVGSVERDSPTSPRLFASMDFHGIVVGRLLGVVAGSQVPLVALPEPMDLQGVPARSIVDLHHEHIGRSVLLMFEQADYRRPIVMGVLRDGAACAQAGALPLEIRYDGGRVLLSADVELVLRCGKAHLTLHHDGRVDVRGETIVTRAAGANKVQGGSVQLN